MKQKDIFFHSEADAWYQRNAGALRSRDADSDVLLAEALRLTDLPPGIRKAKILEIGCGDGTRLSWLKKKCEADCYGVEPSAEAVEEAKKKGITVYRATAEQLPFDDKAFDIVMFGFCLYLCDREDLFRIAHEANRVLRSPGWLLILDFYSPMPLKREYHHRSGLFSYKMDYRTLFTWNPSYTCFSHKVYSHSKDIYTDDPQEWVSVSVLRKLAND